MNIKANAWYTILLLGGIFIGGILHNLRSRDHISVSTLYARDIVLVDGTGHTRAEFKTDAARTYLMFFDPSNRPRLTLSLDERGPNALLLGAKDTNKIALSVNDPLQTASISTSALVSAINVVGSDEARLKLTDSTFTDARSASLSIGPRVSKLRLTSDQALAQLWSENELGRRPVQTGEVSAALEMRTVPFSQVLVRTSSEEKPKFLILDSTGNRYDFSAAPPAGTAGSRSDERSQPGATRSH